MNPKVSVIVPVYNNEIYVVTCVKSLLAQTLEDIEVICINDGSTDNSSKVLHHFADLDNRVLVVDKENGGYGVGINTGLDLARGKYVTILESDDFADLDMLETLYNYAEAFDLEVVRANFYLYWAKKIKNDHLLELFGYHECDRVIDPSNRKDQHCFYAQPALWSALYRTDFIRQNNLRLLETPGAAYQDTAFNFKIWACSRRVMFVHKPFVHYRQDNEASSINNPGKVNNICIEYAEIRRWLQNDRPELRKSLGPVATKMMCDAYTWNTTRIAEDFRLDFVKKFGEELAAAKAAGDIDEDLFAPGQLALCNLTITSPQDFINFKLKGIDRAQGFERISRKMNTLNQVAKQNGKEVARDLIKSKIRMKLGRTGQPEINMVDAIDNEMASRKAPVFTTREVVPQISIVLPVYNTASVLRETLDSIFAQSFKDFELICVNDGSTDGSLEVLKEYAAKDSRIRIISQENKGVAAARNVGLAEVSAPYTLILDSDDIFDSEMFSKLYLKAEKTAADIVICSSCEYDGETYQVTPAPWALKLDEVPEADSFTVSEASRYFFQAFMGWPWDRIYRTKFLKDSGLTFPENLANSEDGVFVYGLLMKAGLLSTVSDVLIKHRVARRDSVSNSRDMHPECFYEAICMIKDLLEKQGVYSLLEKSFLNWALDYSIWNITTLTDIALQSRLSNKLLSGGYPVLEYGKHPMSYFDLYGKNMRTGIARLKRLAK